MGKTTAWRYIHLTFYASVDLQFIFLRAIAHCATAHRVARIARSILPDLSRLQSREVFALPTRPTTDAGITSALQLITWSRLVWFGITIDQVINGVLHLQSIHTELRPNIWGALHTLRYFAARISVWWRVSGDWKSPRKRQVRLRGLRPSRHRSASCCCWRGFNRRESPLFRNAPYFAFAANLVPRADTM